MQTVYIETTIVSYYVSRPSRDIVTAARQQLTREWWEDQRDRYNLMISPAVVAEASAGDANAARRRLDAMAECSVLPGCSEVDALAKRLQNVLQIPAAKELDATHLAFSVFYRVDYLLTWNCAHLADPEVELKLARFCMPQDLWVPVVCTPESMLTRKDG